MRSEGHQKQNSGNFFYCTKFRFINNLPLGDSVRNSQVKSLTISFTDCSCVLLFVEFFLKYYYWFYTVVFSSSRVFPTVFCSAIVPLTNLEIEVYLLDEYATASYRYNCFFLFLFLCFSNNFKGRVQSLGGCLSSRVLFSFLTVVEIVCRSGLIEDVSGTTEQPCN